MQTARYFTQRWQGRVPLTVLFWRDMLAVGTLLNGFMGFLALVLLAQGLAGAAAAVHFAPLPYNLFLFLSLWRLPGRPAVVPVIAGAWVAVMTFF